VTLRFAIRPFAATDRDQVREINRLALRMEQPGTFEKLLASCDDALARVAVGEDGRVLGHVIFTPVLIDLPRREVHGMGLGELAVLPGFQRQGIGTRLGQTALDELRTTGCAFSIVVGHASYYPRFGFRPGSSLGLRCQWEKVPDDSFMALVLDEAAMRGVTGVARFRDIA
jgi:putative acetyltransferase